MFREIPDLVLWSVMEWLSILMAFLMLLVFENSAPEQNVRRESESAHANFVRHPRVFLDISPIATKRVLDALYCAMQCLRDERCSSFNFKVKPGADNKSDCQLLATNNYSRASHLMKPTKEFDYYTVLVSIEQIILSRRPVVCSLRYLEPGINYFTDASMACKIARRLRNNTGRRRYSCSVPVKHLHVRMEGRAAQ